MPAAAVQPVALQPLALEQPGTDVSAAAEAQPDHEYTSNSSSLGLCCICPPSFIVRCLPLVDLCSSQLGETADGEEDADDEETAEFNEDRIWLKACTSLIRTRYLCG